MGYGDDLKVIQINIPKYGTAFKAKLYHKNKKTLDLLNIKIIEEIDRLEMIFSTYQTTSELNSIVNIKPNQSFNLSSELFECLQIAQSIYKKSDSVFNPAVAPWTKQWKLARGDLSIIDFKSKHRFNFLEIELSQGKLAAKFLNDVFPIDLGGIAKGYVLDHLAKLLKKENCTRYILSLGGEILTGQPPPNKFFWKIPCEGPDRTIIAEIKLINRALSISGSSYQFLWRNGERISHLYNQKSNKASQNKSIAYVIGERSSHTDAWATVLSINGPDTFQQWDHQIEWGGLLSNEGWEYKSGDLP